MSMKRTGKSTVLATAVVEKEESVKKATEISPKLNFDKKEPKK
jgi:hypothetical protein